MTTKHTPGPWFYKHEKGWHDIVTHHGELPDGSPNSWTVASINTRREPEHEANARLIAAAPELLEALQSSDRAMSTAKHGYAFEIVAHDSVVRTMIRAAIAKATGGTHG